MAHFTRSAALSAALLVAAGCGPTLNAADEVAFSREELSVCPYGPTVPGIDVSEWQGGIDWAQVAGAGYKFAITRINDGNHHDPYFQANWDGIRAVGMVRGAYQFYEPGMSPTVQANMVIAAVGLLGAGDLPVTMDLESNAARPTASDLQTWIDLVTQGTGKAPMIYTSPGYWNAYFSSEFGEIDLWVAHWGVSCPSTPSSWDHWLFWQPGGGPTPGIGGNVDQDVFNGTEQELQIAAGQYANTGCSAGLNLACSHYGCGCASGQCSGGFCPGTGCSQAGRDACGAYGCNCSDGRCNGGYCPGSGCTAKETADCGGYGCNCVDHACNGGFCPGTGCTAREALDCGNYGCGCVDHACNGGACPGTGCTAKQALDCQGQGKACAGGACTTLLNPPDAGSGAGGGSGGGSGTGGGTATGGGSGTGAGGGTATGGGAGGGTQTGGSTGTGGGSQTGGGSGEQEHPDEVDAGVPPAPVVNPQPIRGGCTAGLGAPSMLWAMLLLLRRGRVVRPLRC